MIIGTIVDGLVIDHIPAGRAMELYHYLGLDRLQCEVAIIKNASSEKLGRKDIIKIGEVIDLDQDILGFINSQWRESRQDAPGTAREDLGRHPLPEPPVHHVHRAGTASGIQAD